MSDGIRKFRELLLTDEEFQQKLKAAGEAYTGEQTAEAVFNGVLVPLAAEYGISAAYEEFHTYITGDQEMDSEELVQIAGGSKGGGIGGQQCYVIGLGAGGGATFSDGNEAGGVCMMVGLGLGGYKCAGAGEAG